MSFGVFWFVGLSSVSFFSLDLLLIDSEQIVHKRGYRGHFFLDGALLLELVLGWVGFPLLMGSIYIVFSYPLSPEWSLYAQPMYSVIGGQLVLRQIVFTLSAVSRQYYSHSQSITRAARYHFTRYGYTRTFNYFVPSPSCW